MDLINLGFGGSALLDPFTARAMRDTPADLISVKIGINLVNTDVMRLRAFTSAVHGFLDTVREGHPGIPLLVVSPILCPIHEDTPGPSVPDFSGLSSGIVRFLAGGDPAERSAGKLTLTVIRAELARIVAQRAADDPHLHYLDGRELYGEADVAELPLPDRLHPDAATHRRIGRPVRRPRLRDRRALRHPADGGDQGVKQTKHRGSVCSRQRHDPALTSPGSTVGHPARAQRSHVGRTRLPTNALESRMTAPTKTRAPMKHPVDQVPPVPKLALYGLQHVMAFYAGAVLVPILVASGLGLSGDQLIHLINADLFTCGIASIIQSVGFWKVGVRLPLLQGVTFAGVAPMIAIGVAAGGGTDGLVMIYGSVIVAGLATFFVAPYFGKILRFFPPVVTGSVITIIGITLLQVAANDAIDTGTFDENGQRILDPTDPKLLAYSLGTLLLIVLIQRFFKGFIASIAVLIGLVVGTTVAFIMGDAHFGDVAAQPWVGVTTPFYFGWPKFGLAAIISMLVVMLITAVETTGSVYATGEIVGKRIKKDDIPKALRADGLATTIGGVMNSFPYTCFSENVGLVRLTQVKSRWVIAAAGGIMIILGVLPKTAAIVAGIPHSVLGGAALALFATVAVVGIQSLAKVDFNDHRNMVIVSTSLGIAMFVTFAPGVQGALPDWASILFGSGITAGSFTAIGLNILFFHVGKSYGPAVAGSPGGVIRLDQVNEMTEEEFAETFGGLVQGSPWAVERAFEQRPFADTLALRAAFQDALLTGNTQEQQELIKSYPDLGSENEIGLDSAQDHAMAGLSNLDEDERAEVVEIATEYKQKFGFPFIVCAREIDSYQKVVDLGWSRMANSSTIEHSTALIEIAKIANYRFDDLVADANPIATARTLRYQEAYRG